MSHRAPTSVSEPLLAGSPTRSSRKILLVGTFLSRSGLSYRCVCEDLSDRLKDSGWQVTTASDRSTRLARLIDMVGTTWRRRHAYAIAQVDVFGGPAFFWAESTCWTLRRARKPYVLTLHGGGLPTFARRWPGRVQRLLGSAAAVTTPSHYLRESMRPYRDDLLLIPNPIDLSAYPWRVRANSRPRLVWLRAFHETYNPSLAPKVVARLQAEFPEIHLTMIGPDKGDGSLQRMIRIAKELEVSDRIRVVGGVPKSEVPARLGEGDIFLNTTNVDNTPVSVLEAAACGLCVVSTDVGGIPYLLDHEGSALLVPPDDPEAMAAAVRRLLTEPELAGRLSRGARELSERSDWSVVLPRWESLLSDLAHRGKRWSKS